MRWNFSKVRTRTGGKKNRREVRSWCYAYLFIIDIIIIIIIISAIYDVERSFAELVVDSGKTDFSHHPARRIFTPIAFSSRQNIIIG